MSMVVVHVASSARNILVFLGRMAGAMGHALQKDLEDLQLEVDVASRLHIYSILPHTIRCSCLLARTIPVGVT